MKYQISYTQPDKDKKATFNYKVLQTTKIEEFVKVINSYATCPAKFKNGHRTNGNIEEIFGWLRFDCDEEGEAEQIEKAFKDYFYIKKPSTRNAEYPYKWHFMVKVTDQSNDPQQYKDQCRQVCDFFNIDLKDMKVTYATGAVQNMNAYSGDIAEAIAKTVVNNEPELQLPHPRVGQGDYDYNDEVAGFTNLDDAQDTKIVNPDAKPLAELREMLFMTDANCSRDEWMALIASGYKLAEDPEEYKELVLEWSKTGDTFEQDAFDHVWEQVSSGKFGSRYSGGTLVKKAKDGKISVVEAQIEKAETIDDLKKVVGKSSVWRKGPHPTQEQFEEVAKAVKKKATQLQGKNFPIDDARKLTRFMPKEEEVKLNNIQSYLCENKFNIVFGKNIERDVVRQTLKPMGQALGIVGDAFENKVLYKSILVSSIETVTDYVLDEEVKFELEKSKDVEKTQILTIKKNPLFGVIEPAERKDIVKDFFDDIWAGKAEEIIRIVGLTMRFKETKLNKIHVVAPSNTGKTTFLENIGFQTIHMKRLLQALSADKGIGKNIIDGLKASGFLLVDEANNPLPQDIKNIDNVIHLDQFGKGGTQDIKLHFTCFTSTHKTAVRGMSDEMYNRLLLVELKQSEMSHIITNSHLFLHDNEAYTNTLIQHTKWLLKDAITNPDYTKADLLMLQDKYRLELNDDVGGMLTEISEKVAEEYKARASSDGDILERNGEYYIKRKTDLVAAIEDRMSEYAHIDKGKYADELVNHFIKGDRKRIKIHGRPVNYYPLNLKIYYADEADEVLSMFDNLDEEELDFL